MRSRTAARVCVIACAALSVGLAAQEGHPLTGTWSGDWGATPDKRTRITLVMTWNGKALTGTINPGPEAMTVGRVTVEPGRLLAAVDTAGLGLVVNAPGAFGDGYAWNARPVDVNVAPERAWSWRDPQFLAWTR
jgi:hypothetical protein